MCISGAFQTGRYRVLLSWHHLSIWDQALPHSSRQPSSRAPQHLHHGHLHHCNCKTCVLRNIVEINGMRVKHYIPANYRHSSCVVGIVPEHLDGNRRRKEKKRSCKIDHIWFFFLCDWKNLMLWRPVELDSHSATAAASLSVTWRTTVESVVTTQSVSS